MVVVGHSMVAVEPAHNEALNCGISLVRPEQYALVCFDDKGQVAWSYELPAGEYHGPIPPIQRIDNSAYDRYRIVAGPDGSLHFVDHGGKLIDRFDYGDSISGLAARVTEKGPFLWVSAGNRLTAWRISAESAP
jgi:hypothetical protein